MAAVARSGDALVADVQAAATAPGRAFFWWLGQQSWIVKAGSHVLYFDPYLAHHPARQTPPLLRPDQITHADWVLCSHDHIDHIDPDAVPGIAAASPQALFVAPRPHERRMRDLGIPPERLRLLSHGESLAERGTCIRGLKAKHEFFDEDPERGFPYLGYVVEVGGVSIYHAGDTLLWEGLIAELRAGPSLDVAFLPINGRDAVRYRRNCLGNMTFQEAVDLAGEVRPRLAVPAHWDMFPYNSEDPQKFADYLAAKYPGIRTWVGPAGERVAFP
ncbi:MAG: MBL fold metallo-hydrolase [Armatimonadetes bacterium]|nr:MBL fold metallo-hydrolase [Armatimonadota bacterium]